MTEPSRFDYVKYDDVAQAKQAKLKAIAQKVEAAMNALDGAQAEMQAAIAASFTDDWGDSRPVELARQELRDACLTEDCYDRLEQSYMWLGKAIRDEQIERNGSAELQEERGDE